jgi:hypothetical protein
MSLGKFRERDHRADRRWRERQAAQHAGRAGNADRGRAERAPALPGPLCCRHCGARFDAWLALDHHDCQPKGDDR